MTLANPNLPQGQENNENREYESLLDWFRIESPDHVLVAFSGGVDSTLVLQAACDALGTTRVTAITADSPSLPRREMQETKDLAERIGAQHILLQTDELQNANYRANLGNRCYFCKATLYSHVLSYLEERRNQHPLATLVDGTNHDDLGDVRPGQRAAKEAGVRHPLVELQIGKAAVRQLSRLRGLPTAEKAEMACLSSRIPPGTTVTAEKLQMIEAAEDILRRGGFQAVRVRYHELGKAIQDSAALPATLARIEVAPEAVTSALASANLQQLAHEIRACGFTFVTIDLEGYRKGGFPSY